MDIEFREKLISDTVAFVKNELSGAESGHDWWHIQRVWNMSRLIASEEESDLLVVELAALLHDISDSKFNGGNHFAGAEIASTFLLAKGLNNEQTSHICQIISNISFSAGKTDNVFRSKELDIVQDADRLDAIGAIGIARAFNYGGYRNREMYNPDEPPKMEMNTDEYRKNKGHTINHFYEKLLLLKDRMNTETGRKIAQKRHDFITEFLNRFISEWDGIA